MYNKVSEAIFISLVVYALETPKELNNLSNKFLYISAFLEPKLSEIICINDHIYDVTVKVRTIFDEIILRGGTRRSEKIGTFWNVGIKRC